MISAVGCRLTGTPAPTCSPSGGRPPSSQRTPTCSAGTRSSGFFVAAAHLDARSPRAWQALAFFTLMHSCGDPDREARTLATEHVDLDGRHLDIISAKGNRSRRLPVTQEVVDRGLPSDAADAVART